MPSMRPFPLNPRAPANRAAPAAPPVNLAPLPPPAAAQSDGEEVAPAGGFHESSYELQQGLQVSESDWPDDLTMPGMLGAR
jgi:hypothetical protein